MKKLILLAAFAATISTASAQYYQDAANKDMLHIRQPRNIQRTEFYAPSIDGYTAYKADLHTHTIFSDGHLSMESRVREAWIDGLDVMAVTEHLEYRPHEETLVKYLNKYMTPGTKARAYSFVSKNEPAKGAIMIDLNFPVELAKKTAEAFDITIIPGIEITRKPDEYCHFNALFTTDNNAIYDPDTKTSIQNAKAQGALVMHNHPGWRRTNLEPTPFEKMAYKAGVIDGIEIMNGSEFYPKAITRALKHNFFFSSNTDTHQPTAERYSCTGARRNMTLIFAKDKSEQSLRKALLSQKTLGYCGGYIIGAESLLKKFFTASVKATYASEGKKGVKVVLTNSTSFAYTLSYNGHKIDVPALGSVSVTLNDKKAIFTVENMIHVNNQRPVVELELK